MSSYTIGEVAERSGFSASTLRYYEGIGLVAPSDRTDGGYRLYDDRALDRLAFIARAKALGCSLEEIADLVSIWDGERCEPVQRRLHELLTDKIGDADRRITELRSFAGALRSAAGRLAGPASDGPCDDGCACLMPSPPTATPRPEPVAIACTLTPDALPQRVDDWRAVLAHARSRTALAGGGLRIELGDAVPIDELAALVAAEQGCCAFFSFAITVDGRGIGLEVRAPDGAEEVVAALFGER